MEMWRSTGDGGDKFLTNFLSNIPRRSPHLLKSEGPEAPVARSRESAAAVGRLENCRANDLGMHQGIQSHLVHFPGGRRLACQLGEWAVGA